MMDDLLIWVSKNALAAIAMAFGIVAILVVFPAIWFSDHGRGEYFGAVVGFAALLAGALFNAHLERERDDRLHKLDASSAVLTVMAEMARNSGILNQITLLLAQPRDGLGVPKEEVAFHLSMLSETSYHKHSEKFMSGTVIAGQFDSRLLDSYLLNVVLLRDYLRNLVITEEGHGIPEARLPDLDRLVTAAAASTTFAMASANAVFQRLGGWRRDGAGEISPPAAW